MSRHVKIVLGLLLTLGIGKFGYEYTQMKQRVEHREQLLEDAVPAASSRDPGSATYVNEPVHTKTFRDYEVLGRPVAHALPEDMRALVFFFHGTGGSRDVAKQTEPSAVLQPMIEAGLGIIAPDSEARGGEHRFNTDAAPPDNPDIQRMIAVYRGLRGAGMITQDTPLFLIGYSAGGGFAGFAGHALLDAGLPLRGIIYHQARGRTKHDRTPPGVPSVWIAADHDHLVDPARVAWEHEQHLLAGHQGLLLRHVARAMTPHWLSRDPAITIETSERLYQRMLEEELIDARGVPAHREHLVRDVEQLTKKLPANQQTAIRQQLKLLNGTHAFHGEYAAQELAFILEHLPAK